MSKKSNRSKIIAGVFVVLTLSIITAITTMVVFYQIQSEGLNPTPRPTFEATTTPPDTRLPRNFLPERYEIFLQLHFYTTMPEVVNDTDANQTLVFTGNSTVYFTCVQRSSIIDLHASKLTVWGSVVQNVDTKETVESTVHEGTSEFLAVHLSEALEVGGNYSLSLLFNETVTDSLEGLYMNTYKEGDAERFLAVTNLQPAAARSVFPCLDEPDLKAVFHLTIIHRRGSTALGNVEVLDSSVIDEEWKYTRFNPTPRMSTYLLAFAVSEFTSTPSSHHRVKINTFARPEAVAAGQTQYASNITGKILLYYEELFGINYPQKKLDQIAVPDLEVLAMENWGLVTYQEGSLLYEEGVSSPRSKGEIALLIAHELAHQWFGNLVTMKWWDELWLNEGFATYLSHAAADHVDPSFRHKELSVAHSLSRAFDEDSLSWSRALVPPQDKIQSNFEIMEMFDIITYSKGALVLRMLVDFVEEPVFNTGIKMYLRALSYQSAQQSDLWTYIQKAVDEDGGHIRVADVMSSWTTQSGFPLITINTTSGEVWQKHFLFNHSSDSTQWWKVPIRVMSNTSSETSLVWLESNSTVTKEELISKNGEWILANVNCSGYYRVQYNPENWASLLAQVERQPQRIPLLNRAQLIDDAFSLARAKMADIRQALNATRFLRKETEFLPWRHTANNLEYIIHMFDRSELYGPIQAYLRRQVAGLYHFFKNYTDNSQIPSDPFLQHSQLLAIELGCSNELPECVDMAKKKFSDWMTNGTNVHPNMRSTIYCQAIAAGGEAEWNFAWNKFKSSSNLLEKDELQTALPCTKKIWLLNRYLEYTLDPEQIRPSDVSYSISTIANNVAGQALAWNFIKANWEHLQKDDTWLIGSVASRFSTQYELDELRRFYEAHDLQSTGTAEKNLEQVQLNMQWVSENKAILLEWFQREATE